MHKAGDTMTGTLYVNVTTDTGSTSDTGAVIVGNKAGENIAIDSNEIMARNNKAVSTLHLNYDGGYVYVGSGGLGIAGTNTSYKLYVNGNSLHNGIAYFGNGTTYYINNSGSSRLNQLELYSNPTLIHNPSGDNTNIEYSRCNIRSGVSNIGSGIYTYETTSATWGQAYFQPAYFRRTYAVTGNASSNITATAQYGSYFWWRQYSVYNTTAPGTRTSYREDYYLPTTSHNRSGNDSFQIFTGKNPQTILIRTASSTQAKVATAERYSINNNRYFYAEVLNSNSYDGKITLNINGAGAKDVYINGAVSSSSNKTLPAGVYLVYYNGTNYYFSTDEKHPGDTWGGNKITSGGRVATANIYTGDTTYRNKIAYFLSSSSMTATTGKPPLGDGHILTFGWDTAAGWAAQLAIGHTTANHLALRGSSDSNNSNVWGSWKTILDSENYNSYAPTKTGTGATGSWAIIANTASNATQAGKLTTNAGSTTQPIFFNAGVPTATSYALKATVNNGTASRLAYYSGANAISSGSIQSDGNYITTTNGSIWAGTWTANTAGSRENQVGVASGSGRLYMYSLAATNGNRGLYGCNAAGTATSYLSINQSNQINGIAPIVSRFTTTTFRKPIITGSGTAAITTSPYKPALWKFNLGTATPNEGDIITIKIPVAGHDNGVFVSTDNGTTYYPVSVAGTSRLTTHYGANQIISLVFTASGGTNSIYAVAGATDRSNVSGAHWCVINYYDSGAPYGIRVYRQTSGYNDDYPLLVSRTLASAVTSTNGGYVNNIYGVIYNANIPTLNPSTGLMKVPGGINATLNGMSSCAGWAAGAGVRNNSTLLSTSWTGSTTNGFYIYNYSFSETFTTADDIHVTPYFSTVPASASAYNAIAINWAKINSAHISANSKVTFCAMNKPNINIPFTYEIIRH